VAPTPWTDETHTDPARSRKPRRLSLYLPWAAALIVAAVWSLAWVWLTHEIEHRADAAAAALRRAGWTIAWDARHVGGYPFRLDVDFTNLRVSDPSGRAAAATALKTEAYAFAPRHWVFYLPGGFAFVRPPGGAVAVSARALRGSIDVSERPPRIALEGDDLVFAPAPGAKPFALAAAKNVQLYTRAEPGDQEALYLSLDGGVAPPDGWLHRLTGDAPLAIKLDGVLSHSQYLRAGSWRRLVGDWSANGGTFDVHALTLSAGKIALDASGGSVTVDNDGRLVGVIEVSPRDLASLEAIAHPSGPPPPISLLTTGAAPNGVKLTFRDGAAWLGPLRLASAPKVY
jgi:hypothetical protein